MKTALTIAGSDSGGGAGIQADLKTFAACRVYGTSAITAVTAQNTVGVQGVYALPPQFVAQQMQSVIEDIPLHALKTGMLANADIITAVSTVIRQQAPAPLIVDPVMVAKSGDILLEQEARRSLISHLIPQALLVTPNLPEAEVITGEKVETEDQMKEAARIIHSMGARNVLIKGGHLAGEEVIDILYDGSSFQSFASSRIPTKNAHGTGCTYASAITAQIAKGSPVPQAVASAKEYIQLVIRHGIPLGKGNGPTHHFAEFYLFD